MKKCSPSRRSGVTLPARAAGPAEQTTYSAHRDRTHPERVKKSLQRARQNDNQPIATCLRTRRVREYGGKHISSGANFKGARDDFASRAQPGTWTGSDGT